MLNNKKNKNNDDQCMHLILTLQNQTSVTVKARLIDGLHYCKVCFDKCFMKLFAIFSFFF